MGMRMAGLSGFDVDSTVEQLMKVERMKIDTIVKDKKRSEMEKEVWQEVNKDVFDFWQNDIKKMKRPSTYLTRETSILNSDAANVSSTADAATGTYSLKVNQLAKSSFLTSETTTGGTVGSSGTLTLTFGGKTVDMAIDEGEPISVVAQRINSEAKDTGITAVYDKNLNRFFLSSEAQGTDDVAIELSGDEGVLDGLGFTALKRTGTGAKMSNIEFNGEALSFDSNTVTIGGLKMELKSTTAEATDIIVRQDEDAVYENIKSFLGKYNDLLAKINTKVSADAAKGFDPLTDEEKKAMTEEDVELWNGKIKDSMLRRNSKLTGLRNSMRNVMNSSSGTDTSGMDLKFLFEMGITTGDYKEKGKLHITGDVDDTYTAGKENILKKKIAEDPEAVAELFSALATAMDEDVKERMSSTTLSSAFKMYNDKDLTEDVRLYEVKISELESKLATIESRYYRQFARMEEALNKMNSQGDYLMSQLG